MNLRRWGWSKHQWGQAWNDGFGFSQLASSSNFLHDLSRYRKVAELFGRTLELRPAGSMKFTLPHRYQ
jgi:hypothetical protein